MRLCLDEAVLTHVKIHTYCTNHITAYMVL